VRERLLRAVHALETAGVPYAIAGGHAVAAWVATVDAGAVRNTPDVDIMVRREDLAKVTKALELAGFVHCKTGGNDHFLDGPDGKERDAVHLVMAGEMIRPEYSFPAPDVTDAAKLDRFWVVKFEALVHMKLTSYRLKDRVHLHDLLDVGLIDQSWVPRMGPELGARLQKLIDTPE
jgi:hypothetical protein